MAEFTIETADHLRRAFGGLVRSTQRREGRPAGHIETLGFLLREGPQTIAQLARLRRVRHQSMSSTVVELEALGLVTRVRDPRDGRSVLIELTPAGSEMVEESRTSRSSSILRAAETALTAEELRILARTPAILDKLRDAMADGTAP